MGKWAIIGIVLGFVFLILLCVKPLQGRQTVAAPQNATKKTPPPPMDVYRGLRDMALSTSREKIGLPTAASPTTPWRVVMDWGLDSGALATVVAVADGNASIYYGSGGGALGGVGHESIRLAAMKAMKIAGELQPQMRLTKDFPLPQRGGVIFYAVTDAGVFTASATEEEMRTHRSAFYKLGDAMQDVITQYRMIQAK